jgi:hypothetical protein
MQYVFLVFCALVLVNELLALPNCYKLRITYGTGMFVCVLCAIFCFYIVSNETASRPNKMLIFFNSFISNQNYSDSVS